MAKKRSWFRNLLTPRQKDAKFRDELKVGTKLTKDGEYKVDNNGRALGLTAEEAAWRAGYIQRGRDNAKLSPSLSIKRKPLNMRQSLLLASR